jgi:hypothetical protein
MVGRCTDGTGRWNNPVNCPSPGLLATSNQFLTFAPQYSCSFTSRLLRSIQGCPVSGVAFAGSSYFSSRLATQPNRHISVTKHDPSPALGSWSSATRTLKTCLEGVYSRGCLRLKLFVCFSLLLSPRHRSSPSRSPLIGRASTRPSTASVEIARTSAPAIR